MPAELFANPPVPGGTSPWGLATLATTVSTTPAPGTVETWTLNQTPTGLSTQTGRFRFVIDNEICIDVTGASGTSRQVWRGAEGTTPATHGSGTPLYHTVTAQALAPLGETFHAVSYGVRADGKTITDGVVSGAGLTSASAAFTSNDVGKLCVVVGAGTPQTATTTGALTSGVGVTALAVGALASDWLPGGIKVTSGANSQTFVTSGAKAGATSIPLIGAAVGGLTSALSTGAAITSLAVAPLNFAVASGTVTLVWESNTGTFQTQTFSTTGAAIGATSIPVTSTTPNFAYPESAIVFGSPLSVNANFSYPTSSAVATMIPALFTTIQTYNSATSVTLANAAGTNIASGAEVFYATNDTTGMTNCLNDTIAAKGKAIVPHGDIGINAVLPVSDAIEIEGQGVKSIYGSHATQWPNAGNFPTTAPYLEGSVIVQCAPNLDIIQYTPEARSLYVRKLGLRFAGRFQNTGNGMYSVAPSGMANVDGAIEDVKVFGHDGNHHGALIDSSELVRISGFRSYGGGGIWYKSNASTPGPPGNATLDDVYTCTFVAGWAQGLFIDGSGLASLGMDNFTLANVEAGMRVPNPVIPNTVPPGNGGSQSVLQTFNSQFLTINFWSSPGLEADQSGSYVAWMNGIGNNRTNDPNFSCTQQAYPSTGPTNGTAYQNLVGKTVATVQEFLLQPTGTATASTTLNGAASGGATSIVVTSATGFAVGSGIQIDTGANMEFAIVTSVSGTTIGIGNPGNFGLEIAHASGVNVSVGAAVLYAQTSTANSWPGKRLTRWGRPVGAPMEHVSFNFPIPANFWYRMDWANAGRMWTDFVATFG